MVQGRGGRKGRTRRRPGSGAGAARNDKVWAVHEDESKTRGYMRQLRSMRVGRTPKSRPVESGERRFVMKCARGTGDVSERYQMGRMSRRPERTVRCARYLTNSQGEWWESAGESVIDEGSEGGVGGSDKFTKAQNGNKSQERLLSGQRTGPVAGCVTGKRFNQEDGLGDVEWWEV